MTKKQYNSRVIDFTKYLERHKNRKTSTASSAQQSENKIDKRLDQIDSILQSILKAIEPNVSKITNLNTKKDKQSVGIKPPPGVDDFGMDPAILEKIRPLFDFMYKKYWRIKTTGIENIPNSGKGMIVGNHSGTVPYDGAMLKLAIMNEHAVRHDVRFLVENFVYHMPIIGTFMHRIGGIRACPENAQRLLDQNHLVVVFPEGVKGIGKYFSQRYQLQRFGRGGFIKLCIKTKAPLIPVGIVGAEEIHPILFKSNTLAKTIGLPYIPITPTFPLLGPLGTLPLPTKWHVHFGKPISFEKYKDKDIDNELLIHKLSERVRSEIQKIIYDLLKKRKGVFF